VLQQLVGGGEAGRAGAHDDNVFSLASGDQGGHSIDGSNWFSGPLLRIQARNRTASPSAGHPLVPL
jgi:hypothetical protein